ncbi:MAG: beta-Ala-His dipeptidase [Methanocalculaceae archaeon]|jgi:dipeptidase D|nr:beta-Ala-His dipeptidase [Methanocalculaceae archaeon]
MNHGHVLQYFAEITTIPRPSGHEEKLREYLLSFAKNHDLFATEDAAGNVCIRKPAAAGFEGSSAVVLQAHMDMVCEKDPAKAINFQTDPIETVTEGDWIHACGTTLGADNGIGIALALDVLAANIPTGPVECVFTGEEETGLTGAEAVNPDFFTGKMLINLDHEVEESICTGCAGGVETFAVIVREPVAAPMNNVYYRLDIDGLTGGHSGTDIHQGRANAIKILAAFLHRLPDAAVCELSGGNLINAIPRHATAVFGVSPEQAAEVERMFAQFKEEMIGAWSSTDPGISLALLPESPRDDAIPSAAAIIGALDACPNGVLAMSRTIPGLVQTSTNLSSIRMQGRSLIIATFQRSVADAEKYEASAMVAEVFRKCGAEITTKSEYPGWTPDPSSPLLQTAVAVYENLFGKEPAITATHGGLECGLFRRNYPALDIISIGPNILGAHSPNERLQISSVEKVRLFLAELLREIGTAA